MSIQPEFQVVSKYSDLENIKMPRRSTKGSAGYDIFNNTNKDIVIPAKSTSDAIPTYIKSLMDNNNVLMILPRSSHGFKFDARLANSVGVIDSDFYNNENNEGHIFIKVRNPSNSTLILKKGEAMAQGIFLPFIKTKDDLDTVGGERIGGLGSTTN